MRSIQQVNQPAFSGLFYAPTKVNMTPLQPATAQIPPNPNLITALIDFTGLYRHLDEQSQIKARPLYAQANALLAIEMTAAQANAADLCNANDKAGQAHRAQDRRALRVQQNDVSAEYGGWPA